MPNLSFIGPVVWQMQKRGATCARAVAPPVCEMHHSRMYDTWPHAKFELDRTNGSGDTARGSARAHVQKHVGLVLWVRHDRMYGIWPHAEVDQNRSSRSRDIVTPCSETPLTRHVQALLQHTIFLQRKFPINFNERSYRTVKQWMP